MDVVTSPWHRTLVTVLSLDLGQVWPLGCPPALCCGDLLAPTSVLLHLFCPNVIPSLPPSLLHCACPLLSLLSFLPYLCLSTSHLPPARSSYHPASAHALLPYAAPPIAAPFVRPPTCTVCLSLLPPQVLSPVTSATMMAISCSVFDSLGVSMSRRTAFSAARKLGGTSDHCGRGGG